MAKLRSVAGNAYYLGRSSCEQVARETESRESCTFPKRFANFGNASGMVAREREPARLVTHTTVVLEAGNAIRRHHFVPTRSAATDAIIGRVMRHPETGQLALRNASQAPWLLHRVDRPDAAIEPGVAVTIRPDMSITVDGMKGRLFA